MVALVRCGRLRVAFATGATARPWPAPCAASSSASSTTSSRPSSSTWPSERRRLEASLPKGPQRSEALRRLVRGLRVEASLAYPPGYLAWREGRARRPARPRAELGNRSGVSPGRAQAAGQAVGAQQGHEQVAPGVAEARAGQHPAAGLTAPGAAPTLGATHPMTPESELPAPRGPALPAPLTSFVGPGARAGGGAGAPARPGRAPADPDRPRRAWARPAWPWRRPAACVAAGGAPFAHGVVFVDLGPTTDPALVPAAVAQRPGGAGGERAAPQRGPRARPAGHAPAAGAGQLRAPPRGRPRGGRVAGRGSGRDGAGDQPGAPAARRGARAPGAPAAPARAGVRGGRRRGAGAGRGRGAVRRSGRRRRGRTSP